jgi:PAS domain-containing protein
LIGLDCSNAAEQSKSLFKDPEGFVIGITELLINKNTKLSEHLEMADGRILERDYIPIFVLGVYKGHLWKYTDVTTRFKYEENLKKQEAKYRSIIENIKLGLLEVNLKDEIQYANQNFLKYQVINYPSC